MCTGGCEASAHVLLPGVLQGTLEKPQSRGAGQPAEQRMVRELGGVKRAP